MLRIEREDLDRAVASNIVSRAQAHALWNHLADSSIAPARDEASAPDVAPPAPTPRSSLPRMVFGGVLAMVLWCTVMDLAPAWLGLTPTMSERSLASILIGVVLLAAGFVLDDRTRRDRAGPVYVAGLAAIVGAVATAGDRVLPAQAPAQDVGWPAMALVVGIVLVFLGLALRRRSFGIFGALALAGAAGQLVDEILVEAAFPPVLAAIGLALAVGSLAWRRVETPLGRALVGHLPSELRRALESRRGEATTDDRRHDMQHGAPVASLADRAP